MQIPVGFSCILCCEQTAPVVIHHKVKGDHHEMLQVVRCPSCGHVQLNPPMYSIDYYNEDEQVNFVVHDYGTPIEKIVEHSWIDAKRRLNRFEDKGISLEQISFNVPLRILDIGGGYGFFGSQVKQKYPSFDVTVLEPSLKRVETGKRYLSESDESYPVPNFTNDLLDQDFVEKHKETYDVVTMWHVLEHVPNPAEFLRLAYQLVKPYTGIVSVEVPNADDELISLSSAFRDRFYMIEHISYFTRHSLGILAHQAAVNARIKIHGYQRYGIFNYFHWIHFNKPQGANPDLFEGKDRWWLEATWRLARESSMTSDALFMIIQKV